MTNTHTQTTTPVDVGRTPVGDHQTLLALADRCEASDGPIIEADIGKMFHVPWSPNLHRLEFIRRKHCQLHGEFIGMECGFRKRRNSEVRPWGNISIADPNNPAILRARAQGDG